jgi:hypothetical protein
MCVYVSVSELQNQPTDLQETFYGVYIITEHSICQATATLALHGDSADPYNYI